MHIGCLCTHDGQAGATQIKSVRRPCRSFRVAPWARADSLHRGSLGPLRAAPETGAVLWARAL
eukprot:1748926-Alexandrium_andersonii.AAC.1